MQSLQPQEQMSWIDFLRKDLHLFQKLLPEDQARILATISLFEVKKGKPIYKKGDSAESLYFLVEGKVELQTFTGNKSVLKPGEFFGEETGIAIDKFTGTAKATSNVKLIGIPDSTLHKITEKYSEVVEAELFTSFLKKSGDVKFSDEKLSKIVGHEDKSKDTGEIRRTLGWFFAMIFPLGVLSLDLGLNFETQAFLAVLSSTLSMWVFKLAPDYVPGIFTVLTALTLGITPTDVALSGFASDDFVLALSVLSLGAIIVSSGVIYRILLIILKYVPATNFACNLVTMILGIFFTPTVPSTGSRAGLMTPFVSDFTEAVKYKPGGRAATRLAITSFTGITLFTPCFLSSSLHNFIIFGLLYADEQQRFQWVGWLTAALVPMILYLISYSFFSFVFFYTKEKPVIERENINQQLRILGRLKGPEWAAIVCFALFTIGVITTTVHKIPPAWLAMGVLYIMLSFGILNTEKFQTRISWPSLMLLGALIGMVGTFNHLGLDDWIAYKLEWISWYMRNDFQTFILLLFGIVTASRLVIPQGPAIVILATIFVPTARSVGVSVWVICFLILVFGKSWFFPYQYNEYVDYRDSLGRKAFNANALLYFNLLMNAVKVGVVYASIPYWKTLGLL